MYFYVRPFSLGNLQIDILQYYYSTCTVGTPLCCLVCLGKWKTCKTDRTGMVVGERRQYLTHGLKMVLGAILMNKERLNERLRPRAK